MSLIVGEKASGIRRAMRTMGLGDAAYWASWAAFDLAVGALLALAIICSGEPAAAARARPANHHLQV